MSQNKEALANGLLQNLSFQREVAKQKLNQQTKVGSYFGGQALAGESMEEGSTL